MHKINTEDLNWLNATYISSFVLMFYLVFPLFHLFLGSLDWFLSAEKLQ